MSAGRVFVRWGADSGHSVGGRHHAGLVNACLSCLTWLIAIPVLLFCAIAIGPGWLLLLGVILFVCFWLGRPRQAPSHSEYCPTCGRPCDGDRLTH